MTISRWANNTGVALIVTDVNDVQVKLLPGEIIVGDFYEAQSPPLTYVDDQGSGIDLTNNRNVGKVIGGTGSRNNTDDQFASVVRSLRDPDITDHLYDPGAIWINDASGDSFILTSSENKTAVWQYIGEGGSGGPITEIDGGSFI